MESVAEVSDPPAEEREVPKARGEDGCLDLRVRLKGRDGRLLVLELDSRVLCESSLFFKGMLMGSRKKDEIVVEDVEDLGAFRETIEMMYENDLMRWLMEAGVSKSIDVLEVRPCSCPVFVIMFGFWFDFSLPFFNSITN